MEKDTTNEPQEASSLNEEPPTYATLATDLEKDQLVEAVTNIDNDLLSLLKVIRHLMKQQLLTVKKKSKGHEQKRRLNLVQSERL